MTLVDARCPGVLLPYSRKLQPPHVTQQERPHVGAVADVPAEASAEKGSLARQVWGCQGRHVIAAPGLWVTPSRGSWKPTSQMPQSREQLSWLCPVQVPNPWNPQGQ